MSSMENEPLEVRKAYAISELHKIVMTASSMEVAKADCKVKLQELVREGVVRNFDQDVLELREVVTEEINKKFSFILLANKLFTAATELQNEKQYSSAIEMYKDAIQLNPHEPDYYCGLGRVYYKLGQYEQALEVYQNQMTICPVEPSVLDEYYHDLAGTYWKLGQYEKAIDCYNSSIALNPTVDLCVELADVLMKLKRYDEAITLYQLAVELKPDEASYYNKLGVSYYRLGEYVEALGAFQQAISLKSEISTYHANQGDSFFKLGEYEKTTESYQRAIELNPDSARYYGELGDAYYMLRKYEEAIAACMYAINLDPHISIYYYDILFFASIESGKGRKIAKQIEELIESREIDDDFKKEIEEYIHMGKVVGLAPGWLFRWARKKINWDEL